jgi:transcriptional regulator with XRE-family HTH domain
MTPDELREARKSLGWTQHELAENFRMGAHGWQTVSAWENGKQRIPGPIELLCEIYVGTQTPHVR